MSDQPTPPNPAFPIDRKVWAPQIAMVLVFLIAFVASKRGMDIPAEIQVVLTGFITASIGGIVGWFTPAARSDITSKMTNSLVAEAQADPSSPVDLSKVITDQIVIEAQLDTENSAVSMPKGETVKSLETKLASEKRKPRGRKV